MTNTSSIDWYSVTYSVSNSAAFGYYDSDDIYIAQSQRVLKYVVRSLGWPMMEIQLLPQHIFTSFQSAIMKYTAIVNEVTISDNILSAYGQDADTDLTKAGIYGNLSSIFQISEMYGQESTIRQSLHNEIYTASINVIPGKQQYDLSECIPAYTNSNVQILEVYHFPQLYRTAMMDPMINPGFNMASVMNEFGGVYQSNARLIIMPIYETLLKMQTLQLTDQIRRSHFGFELRKNKIVLLPTPKRDVDVIIQYILKTDKYQNSIVTKSAKGGDVINSVATYPILSNLPYNDINTVGRNWIYKYTLALSKQILGLIRSKYSTIPYAQGQTSLDGQTLRGEAIMQQDKLVDSLRAMLDESTMHRLVQKKLSIAQNTQNLISKVPLRIWIA